MKLLILEPDDAYRELLVEALTQEGVEIRAEKDDMPWLFHPVLRNFIPNLVIMSWAHYGQELLYYLRRHRWPLNHDVQIWALTGFSPRDIHVEAAEADLILGKADTPLQALKLMVGFWAEKVHLRQSPIAGNVPG